MTSFYHKKYSILIIGSDTADQKTISDSLAQLGFGIQLAATGEAGVMLASLNHPALILIDLDLPDISGSEVYRRIKADQAVRDIPVIFMASTPDIETQRQGEPEGEIDVIQKPVSTTELLTQVKAKLDVAQLVMENLLSEQEYRSLAENLPDNIIRYDRQCRTIYLNSTMSDTLGLDPEELIGKTPVEMGFSGVAVTAEYQRHIQQVLDSGKSSDMQLTIPDRNRNFRVHLIRFAPERDIQGEVIAVLAIGRDITEQIQAEQERQQRTEFLANMDRINRAIQRAQDLETMMSDVLGEVLEIFSCDRAVLFYPCDPAAAAWSSPMEKTRPEYPGLTEMRVEIPWDPEVAAMLELQLKTSGVLDYGADSGRSLCELNRIKNFGIQSLISTALYPKVGSPWQFALHQCSHERSWTESEKRLLQEIGYRLTDALTSLLILRDLRESEEKYRRIFDTTSEGIWVQDKDLRTAFANTVMAQMLGYSIDELNGRLVTDFMFEEDIADHRAKTEERKNRLSGVYERRFKRKDGSTLWTLLSATPVFEDGEFNGSFAMMTDITQRKQDEQALQRLNRELHALSDCNQVLIRAENEQELLDEICQIICQEAGYQLVWVGYAESDPDKSVRPVAWTGENIDFNVINQLPVSWGGAETGQGPSGIAIRNGEIAYVNDFKNDPSVRVWREITERFHVQSSIALPLKDENRHTFGVLSIYSSELNAFTSDERKLLAELADDLAFGIVTLRRRIEHEKAEEQIRIAATAFEAQEGIIITDAQNSILSVNTAFSEITGYSAQDAIGSTPNMLRSGHHDKAFYEAMWASIQRDGVWQGEIWNRRKNGEVYPGWANITVVKNPNGEISHYVGTMTDITERKAAEARIEHLAYHDPLTLLPNRRLLLDRLQQALAAAARRETQGALLFIDLDNFKLLNDTRGHDAGDQLLVEVAQRLLTCVREEDTVARVGGDEFMILLNNLGTQTRQAIRSSSPVAEKIISVLGQPYVIDGHTHYVTPSVGITLFSGNHISVPELMKQADIAMYQAKSDGRNTLRYFNPEMQAELAARAALETALRVGIEQRQFLLLYQPQVDQQRGIVGAEVLLRWNHPQRGIVSPTEFIPIAEETGLILPIGHWVLETACKQLYEWSLDPDKCDLKLAVNVSPFQFKQVDFVERVQSILEFTHAPAQHLKLELTESMLLECITDSINKMNALKALGVEFSLDDFGTGYSSLSYLTRLPLEQVKIDRSFISQLPDNHNDAVIAQTIIIMAHSLDMSVIAEGIETEEQLQFIQQHGCTSYQGYLFSKPVTLDKFEDLLSREGCKLSTCL
jgi:diguanylate cyclase (GGDEF)-like protein/PAS domain S-box-containing protein